METNLNDNNVCCYCFSAVESQKESKPPKECPQCKRTNWKKTKTERECFFYQKKYLENRGIDKGEADKALASLHFLIEDYAEGMIKAKLNGRALLPNEELRERAESVAFLILQEYLKKPKFVIETSFGGYMNFKIRQVLLSKEQQFVDKLASLNSKMESGVETIEMIDADLFYQSEVGAEYFLNENHEENVVNDIVKIIEKYAKKISDEYSKVIATNYKIAIANFLEGNGKIHVDNFCSNHEGLTLKVLVDDSIDAIRDYLKA